jgi:hypothetical protein
MTSCHGSLRQKRCVLVKVALQSRTMGDGLRIRRLSSVKAIVGRGECQSR